MSSSSNIEKNKNYKKLDIITILDNSKKARIFFLIALGISGLGIRLYFFPYDVPILNDGQGYFWYAIDMSMLNQFPPGHSIINNGWPSLLSIIFQLIDSDSFLDYHNSQRFIGVIFSVATIFPVYILCSRYFKKSYSLLGASLFVFEPRLIQNSFLGTPESFYVFLIAMLLCLFLTSNFKKIYLAFGIIALLSLVRYEGFLMIIPISAVFFIRFRKQKKDLIKYAVCISIFILILVPIAYLKNETMGQDGVVSHISAGPKYYQATIDENSSTLVNYLYLGSSNLIKYIGWAQIPSFIIFVPLGIICVFRSIDYKKITIILTILIMLIPAFYGYSRDYQEIKYIFALYPVFCVLACFSFKFFIEKFSKKNLFVVLIICGIITSSIFYLDWKEIDQKREIEVFQIMNDISQKEIIVNRDMGKEGNEFSYLHWTRLNNVDEFPILKKTLPPMKIKYFGYQINVAGSGSVGQIPMKLVEIDNPNEYFQFVEQIGFTHILVDETNASSTSKHMQIHFKDIFSNEEKYPFLIKEYDSKENGYSYHVKLFEIDYNKFNKWDYGE